MMRPNRMRTLALAVMGVLCLVVGAEKPTDKPVKPPQASIRLGDLHAEVAVLQVLHALQLTPAQAKTLLDAAPRTMQSPPPRRAIKVSARYSKALNAFRAALISGDGPTIESTQEALEKIREKEDPEQDEVEITDEARRLAPSFLKRFSARQVAYYVGGLSDFPDPLEDLIRTMGEAHTIEKKAWPALRDDLAFQVGWLVGGLASDSEEKVRDRVTGLLDRVARLDKTAFEKQRPALEKEARAVVGELGPTEVLRHFMERVIAELISNHRFAAALKLRK